MYSEADLDAAVSAGVLSPEGAAAFRSFVAGQRASSPADEEHFRLLTGFNDIFVSIAILLTLFALNWVIKGVSPWAGSLAMAAASWGLAEYFTRRRRMALPSIVLFLSFCGSLFFGLLMLLATPGAHQTLTAGVLALTAGGAYLHWRRFMVPITLAAGAAVTVGAVAMLAAGAVPDIRQLPAILFLLGGSAVFALAMYWDVSDPERKTRRSDVGFWLHLAAAPMIVHPAFSLLGLSGIGFLFAPAAAQQTPPDLGAALIAIVLYLLLAAVAVIVDRRALLVSALAYVLYALTTLFKASSLNMSAAMTCLLIGSALLLLSALWHKARQGVLGLLPDTLRARLPRS